MKDQLDICVEDILKNLEPQRTRRTTKVLGLGPSFVILRFLRGSSLDDLFHTGVYPQLINLGFDVEELNPLVGAV